MVALGSSADRNIVCAPRLDLFVGRPILQILVDAGAQAVRRVGRIRLGERMRADQRPEHSGRARHSSKTRRAKAQHLQPVSCRLRSTAVRRKLGKRTTRPAS